MAEALMGLYRIHCRQCDQIFLWFSGNLDQRCSTCIKNGDRTMTDEKKDDKSKPETSSEGEPEDKSTPEANTPESKSDYDKKQSEPAKPAVSETKPATVAVKQSPVSDTVSTTKPANTPGSSAFKPIYIPPAAAKPATRFSPFFPAVAVALLSAAAYLAYLHFSQ